MDKLKLPMYIREEWIKNSEFYQDSNEEVLSKVRARVRAVLEQKKLPIVIFDIDSTLFDVSKRSYEILREWLAHPETQSFKETAAALDSPKPHEFSYSLEQLWEEKKIP